jgi:acyl-CoA thioester hydrolase
LFNEAGELLNKGVTTLVFYDPIQKKTIDMPDELYKRLAPHFTENI